MICRVAESCFWMHRYLERVDATARALRVNGFYLLDTHLADTRQWRPLVIVAGEEERFAELLGEDRMEDGETVQRYLVWDERNPASIYNSLRGARENARTIRETISLEMWEAVNALWHWLRGEEARSRYADERAAFYEKIQEGCYLIQGITYNTMLHEEPFDFMRLGLSLERASQTGRILDVKHHALGPSTGDIESPAEIMEWQAILRSCSAYEPFFKRIGANLSGHAVARLLLLDPAFPRSVLHCLHRARNFLARIRNGDQAGRGEESTDALETLIGHLEEREIQDLLRSDTHEELTWVIDRTAEICDRIREEFFQIDGGGGSGGRGANDGGDGSGGGDGRTGDSGSSGGEIARAAGSQAQNQSSTHSDAELSPPYGPYPARSVREQWEVQRQRLEVIHTTTYRYADEVRRSSHLLRLRPETDLFQSLDEFHIDISVQGPQHAFEDVFGNHSILLEVSEPFRELAVRSRSVVEVGGRGQRDPYLSEDRPTLPLVWMPWEHQILFPYLLPPELPAYQLRELTEYARSFGQRNNGDLFETLMDLCVTLNAEYDYVPGSTNLETTPYEVFQTRTGVCQDFANLFICLARLHNIPARYRVGYIFTGGRYERHLQSEASHAWAEVYLPWVGWRGFDPTNGIMTDLDHVRVSRGRIFRDATPTSGIIYEGGGGEELEVDVKVNQLPD